jgi:hypothetical protein
MREGPRSVCGGSDRLETVGLFASLVFSEVSLPSRSLSLVQNGIVFPLRTRSLIGHFVFEAVSGCLCAERIALDWKRAVGLERSHPLP